MSNLDKVISEYSDDMNAIQNFCDSLYRDNFDENFKEVRNLYTRMKSDVYPITDAELEYILTTFPMELFSVAERLNKLRLSCEVVKLKNKELVEKLRSDAMVYASEQGMNKTKTNEYVARVINKEMTEYEILHSAYSSVITRVENEQTFSKELIMGAKKVWDSRRNSELSNPVGMVVPEDLPTYSVGQES